MTEDEVIALVRAKQLYWLFSRAYAVSLLKVFIASLEGKAFQSVIQEATRGIYDVLFRSVPGSIGQEMKAPIPWVQTEAILNLSGWVRLQTRMYGSHRAALSEFGEPRTVLAEWLPGWVWDAIHNGVETPSELLKTVRHRLDAVRQKSSRGARSIPQSQKHQPKALETWQAQETMRLDVSALTENVQHLSPMQSLTWALRQQGWKLREIAALRAVDIGTIKTEIFRIKCKYAEAQRRLGSIA